MNSVSENVLVLLLVALKSEAKPIIKNLKLKQRKGASNRYYANDEVGLLITGVGSNIIEEQLFDIIKEINPLVLLNIGICGTTDKKCDIGEIFYVNKVRCDKTNKVFYPDTLVKTDIPNSSIVTFDCPQMDYTKHLKIKFNYLVDMESAILFRILHREYGPHKFQILKIVSDHLSNKDFSRVRVQELMESSLSSINDFLCTYISFAKSIPQLSIEALDFIQTICRNLRLTKTQSLKISRLVTYKCLHTDNMLEHYNFLTEYKSNNKIERSSFFLKVCDELLQ